jgi:hypothetical protein
VLAAAREHLHPDRQAVILVGDVGAFEAAPADLGLPVTSIPTEE